MQCSVLQRWEVVQGCRDGAGVRALRNGGARAAGVSCAGRARGAARRTRFSPLHLSPGYAAAATLPLCELAVGVGVGVGRVRLQSLEHCLRCVVGLMPPPPGTATAQLGEHDQGIHPAKPHLQPRVRCVRVGSCKGAAGVWGVAHKHNRASCISQQEEVGGTGMWHHGGGGCINLHQPCMLQQGTAAVSGAQHRMLQRMRLSCAMHCGKQAAWRLAVLRSRVRVQGSGEGCRKGDGGGVQEDALI